METAARRSNNPLELSLEEQLYAQPYEFTFHQAVRILSSTRDCLPFGEGNSPKEDPVWIRSHISYAAPAAELFDLSTSASLQSPPILSINFFGIAGSQGPLPQPYTELLTERLRQRDTAFRDFLDIFNHRLVSCWYRVEKKFIPGLENGEAEETSIGRSILDLAGFSNALLTDQIHIHNRSLMAYAPLFWQRQKSVAGLQKLLSGYFNCEVKIKEFFGAWRIPPEEDQSRLGIKLGRYNDLGRSMILGSKSWDYSAGLRLHLQQLSWNVYIHHLPGGTGNNTFKDLFRLYTGLGSILELKASVKKEEIPPSHLGNKMILGQTSWLTRGNGSGFTKDPEVFLGRFS